jgi:hypothetical protein
MMSFVAILALTASPAQVPAPASWKPYTPLKSPYSVALPPSPTDLKRTIGLRGGTKIDLIGASAKTESATYSIVFGELPLPISDRAAILDDARDELVKDLAGNRQDESRSVREGGLARDLTIEIPAPAVPGGGVARGRILLIGNRLYELVVIQSSAESKRDSALVDSFFASFQRATPARLSAKAAQEETKARAIAAKEAEAKAETPIRPGWQVYRSDDGDYSVQFPGKPAVTAQKANSTVAGEIDIHVATFRRAANEDFVVLYNDYPEGRAPTGDLEKLYDNARLGGLANSGGGRLASERKVVLGDLSGREIKIDVPAAKVAGGGVIQARYFLKDGRLYQVIYRGPKAKAKADEVAAFLDSFRLTEP